MSEQQKNLQFAQALALKAGAIMKKYLQVGIDRQIKIDGSRVTIADKEINELVIKSIRDAYPIRLVCQFHFSH
jgi:3'-phosphoadenosine 5'-phosphosulfate (PAPS) 3'-phosphatase